VYDISECCLKNIPAGTFSTCKVQRKEALLLHKNELAQLSGGGMLTDLSATLQVLDLHANHLEKLPDELGSLKELKVSVDTVVRVVRERNSYERKDVQN